MTPSVRCEDSLPRQTANKQPGCACPYKGVAAEEAWIPCPIVPINTPSPPQSPLIAWIPGMLGAVIFSDVVSPWDFGWQWGCQRAIFTLLPHSAHLWGWGGVEEGQRRGELSVLLPQKRHLELFPLTRELPPPCSTHSGVHSFWKTITNNLSNTKGIAMSQGYIHVFTSAQAIT